MKPVISASKVAALIGLNKYQSQNETIYDLLCKDKIVKIAINELERSMERRSFKEVRDEILTDKKVNNIVYSALRECKNTSDVKSVLVEAERKAEILMEQQFPDYDPEIRKAFAEEIRGKVSKHRGLQNEDHILNVYEQDHNVQVTERNTKQMRKDYGSFIIIGRTDGWVASENRVVDSKDRTRYWPEVPIYDEVQLRVYMDMIGCPESELIERFPDGTKRITKFLNDPVKWDEIFMQIKKAVEVMNKALEDKDELKRIVESNTIKVKYGGGSSTQNANSTVATLDI